MHQFLKTKKEIKNWLDTHGVHNYTWVENAQHGYLVDVEGHVFLNSKNLSVIPVQFNHVTGSFFCPDNHLTSLMGCPNTVGGDFHCEHNQITSLQYTPQSVGDVFYAKSNAIENLQFCPQNVGNFIYLDRNPQLGAAQKITDFKEIYKIHQETLIEKEKLLLSQQVANQPTHYKNYKI